MKARLLSFDFDGTLAYFNNAVTDGLFAVFEKQHVPRKILVAAYQNLRNSGGFSITRFAAVLHGAGFIADASQSETEGTRWLKNSLELYPDAAQLIGATLPAPATILTFGDPDYQRQKISLVGLDHFPSYIVSEPFSKAKPLRELLAIYGAPIIHVDDVGAELDAIRHAGLTEAEVITYHIVRPGTTMREPKFPHRRIETLREIL